MVRPQLFLFASRRTFTAGDDVALEGVLKLATGGSLSVSESRLVVRDERGQEVARQDDWFRLRGARLSGPSVRTSLRDRVPLPAGSYVAEWSVDEDHAPPVAFTVAERWPDAPDWWPPRLDWVGPSVGVAWEPDLLVRLTNPSDRVLDLAGALFGSRLLLDGAPYPHRGAAWDGASELTPGHPSWHLLSFDVYQRPSPGQHRLQLEVAGARSNELVVQL